MTRAELWYNMWWARLYRLNPAWLGGCRGVFLAPYLESAGFKEIWREFISQTTFPSEILCCVNSAIPGA